MGEDIPWCTHACRYICPIWVSSRECSPIPVCFGWAGRWVSSRFCYFSFFLFISPANNDTLLHTWRQPRVEHLCYFSVHWITSNDAEKQQLFQLAYIFLMFGTSSEWWMLQQPSSFFQPWKGALAVCFLIPCWALWRKIRQLPRLIMLFHPPPPLPLSSSPPPLRLLWLITLWTSYAGWTET